MITRSLNLIRVLRTGEGQLDRFIQHRPNGNTVLYSACRSLDPNLEIVELLLGFGFSPNIPNGENPPNGQVNASYPQHGVVAAASEILGSKELTLEQKKEKLKVLKAILEKLRSNGADMSLKNRVGPGYTAEEEYSTRFGEFSAGVPPLSIEGRIHKIDPNLSISIRDLLRPPPGPPPPG